MLALTTVLLCLLVHAQEDSDVKGEGAGEDSESDGGSTSQLIDDFHSMTLNSFCEPAFQRRVRV